MLCLIGTGHSGQFGHPTSAENLPRMVLSVFPHRVLSLRNLNASINRFLRAVVAPGYLARMHAFGETFAGMAQVKHPRGNQISVTFEAEWWNL